MSEIIEFPKWVYPSGGPQDSYADGEAPVLVNDAEEEAAIIKPSKPRGKKTVPAAADASADAEV